MVREVDQPPVLETVGLQKVNEGDTLTVRLQARDADVPAQTLTFDLYPSFPSHRSADSSGELASKLR